MSRSSALLDGVAVEKNELAAFWAWPLLLLAFLLFGAIGAGATLVSWCSSSKPR